MVSISEAGLYQLQHASSISNNAYKATELMSNNQNNGKCQTERDKSLVKWAQRVAREEWTWEVFDFELLSLNSEYLEYCGY
ncbi:hypothetical protein Peur_030590 [Populus x canadensis]